MKRISLLFLILFCFYSFAFSQANVSKIVGAYQRCPFHCETFKLNADYTFDSILDGDLFNDIRAKGTWKFIDKDKIHLKTEEKLLEVKVEEKSGEQSDKIKIRTIDDNGAIYPYIKIQANKKEFVTDENGFVEIPKTDEITISYQHLKNSYQIKSKNISELEIEVYIDSSVYAYTDSVFIIRKNEICLIAEDSKELHCYKKLKKSSKRKLFPPNKK